MFDGNYSGPGEELVMTTAKEYRAHAKKCFIRAQQRVGVAASVIGNGGLLSDDRHEDGVFRRQPRRARTRAA